MNSAFAYFGGKSRMTPHIISEFPNFMDAYIEPYFGSGAVFFAAPGPGWAKDEILNDLNGDVVNFFEVLRDQPGKLTRLLELTPSSRRGFYEAKEKLAKEKIKPGTLTRLERARCFFVSIEQSFSNTQRGWKLPTGDHVKDWLTKTRPDRLLKISARLRSAGFENYPALKVIDLYDKPGRLFYLDPPYIVEDQDRMNDIDESYRGYGMTEAEHKELVTRLLTIQGMALVSGYDHPVYAPLVKAGWRVVRIETMTQIASNSQTKNKARTEILWINPALQAANRQKLLF